MRLTRWCLVAAMSAAMILTPAWAVAQTPAPKDTPKVEQDKKEPKKAAKKKAAKKADAKEAPADKKADDSRSAPKK